MNFKKLLIFIIFIGLIIFIFSEKKYTIIIRNEWDEEINVSITIDGLMVVDTTVIPSHLHYTSIKSNLKFGNHKVIYQINNTIIEEENLFIFKNQWSTLFTYKDDGESHEFNNHYFKPLFQ